MRLKKAQKEKLLELVAEGLATDEINQCAASFDDPFSVSRQQVDWYRKTRKIDIEALRQSAENKALNTGLALVSERVNKLKALAGRLELDLFRDDPDEDKVWTLQVKGVGSGPIAEIVEYYEFNRSEIDAYRGLLDDIAKETGGRVQKTDITSGGEKIAVVGLGFDTDKL